MTFELLQVVCIVYAHSPVCRAERLGWASCVYTQSVEKCLRELWPTLTDRESAFVWANYYRVMCAHALGELGSFKSFVAETIHAKFDGNLLGSFIVIVKNKTHSFLFRTTACLFRYYYQPRWSVYSEISVTASGVSKSGREDGWGLRLVGIG